MMSLDPPAPARSAGYGQIRYTASRASPTYLRFTIQKQDPDSKRKTGLLVAAHEIRDEADLSVEEHETIRLALQWFNDHLDPPPVLQERGTERALSWFKPDAMKPLAHMWALAEIVERFGYVVEFHKTRDPGEILYEDGWQIVARPRKGSNASR